MICGYSLMIPEFTKYSLAWKQCLALEGVGSGNAHRTEKRCICWCFRVGCTNVVIRVISRRLAQSLCHHVVPVASEQGRRRDWSYFQSAQQCWTGTLLMMAFYMASGEQRSQTTLRPQPAAACPCWWLHENLPPLARRCLRTNGTEWCIARKFIGADHGVSR